MPLLCAWLLQVRKQEAARKADPRAAAPRLHIGLDEFEEIMIEKAVDDFAKGEKALLPAFEALDTDGDGRVSQADMRVAIDSFCTALPEAAGCATDKRPKRVSEAVDAFANDEHALDYECFVEMISGRNDEVWCRATHQCTAPSALSARCPHSDRCTVRASGVVRHAHQVRQGGGRRGGGHDAGDVQDAAAADR